MIQTSQETAKILERTSIAQQSQSFLTIEDLIELAWASPKIDEKLTGFALKSTEIAIEQYLHAGLWDEQGAETVELATEFDLPIWAQYEKCFEVVAWIESQATQGQIEDFRHSLRTTLGRESNGFSEFLESRRPFPSAG